MRKQPRAFYNEIDPYAADWLETLILLDLIAPGDVDRRSIEDVTPNDLRGYTQCHFFAGIGGWSLALRLAGWPDDRPVWTGSCPCQPFSAAGQGKGTADERHLWPAWYWLIAQCRPHVIFGEQVEAAVKHDWLDLVHADMEGIGYAVGATCVPAAGIGSPHGRSRLWFVADTDGRHPGAEGVQRSREHRQQQQAHGSAGVGMADDDRQRRQIERRDGIPDGEPQRRRNADGRGTAGSVADGGGARLEGHVGHGDDRDESGRVGADAPGSVATGGGADALADGEARRRSEVNSLDGRRDEGNGAQRGERFDGSCEAVDPGPTHGFWRSADWLLCRDGKFRPVESPLQRMVDGLPESLGHLRPDQIAAIEKEIVNAATSEARAREALRDVLQTNWQEALRETAGGLIGVPPATLLFAFLCQLTTQGWYFSKGTFGTSAQAHEGGLRVLWSDLTTARAPHQRGLEGRSTGEHSDLVRVLSSILARHAKEAWDESYNAHAKAIFPLRAGEPNRVGRLRAYGNAIVPQVAAEVIGAYMELGR